MYVCMYVCMYVLHNDTVSNKLTVQRWGRGRLATLSNLLLLPAEHDDQAEQISLRVTMADAKLYSMQLACAPESV